MRTIRRTIFARSEQTTLDALTEQVVRCRRRLADVRKSSAQVARLLKELQIEAEELRAARLEVFTIEDKDRMDRLLWGIKGRQDELFFLLGTPMDEDQARQDLRDAEIRLRDYISREFRLSATSSATAFETNHGNQPRTAEKHPPR